jgi:KDO2-lipid IV(A) lauroyltransferase
LSDAIYILWPEKRRYVRANAARVLGVDANDRRAGSLARAVFRNQTRWIVEGFHLPRMSREEHVALMDTPAADQLHDAWLASQGTILVGLHLGNGDAAAAALAGRGWPVNVLADDTAYDELFELMFAQRREWGVEVIRWRNLREVYRVLRDHQMLALLVDWGYRAEAQPVRLLGSWTTLPSGPAVLAARTGATIVPFWTLRLADGTFGASVGRPITVPSTDAAAIAMATQAIADALEPGIRAAPEQWCVFKPMWPLDRADEAALEDRWLAVTGAAGPTGSGGPAAAGPGTADGTVPAGATSTTLAEAPR